MIGTAIVTNDTMPPVISWHTNVVVEAGANGLAGTAADVFYSVWMDEGPDTVHDDWSIHVEQFSGTWPMTPAVSSKGFGRPATAALDSVCSQGRAVGWQKATATNAGLSYVTDVNGAASTLTRWNVYGLDGAATGEAFCVGTDGTIIFSMSPKAVFTGTTNYGYKAVFDATFPVPATQLSTNLLSNFPDTTGSTNLVTPYGCTPDGTYAVGMS